MRIDYKLQDKFDFGLFIPLILLYALGLAAIYSSTVNNPLAQGNFEKQLIWGIGSLIVFFITFSLPTNTFRIIAVPTYLVSLAFLLLVVLVGRRIAGQKSWLNFGLFGFQPSEFAKIGMILGVSYFLSRRNTDIESFKDILFALGIGLIPVFLILMEPDMGTSLVFIGTILVLIFWKGISLFGLFVVLSPGIVAIASIFGTFYFILMLIIIAIGLVAFKKDIFFSGSIFAINIGAGFFTDYVYKALSPHQQ
ncbi:MAG TPA: FtsW/RodA/SpoVE family cell cycle protein, partial [Ignavibacteriaceae bacterium]|nr:FtsW/RodA/SpoVE family cell cycle protein [Ignavibacteriaceae bacterium]